MTVCFGKARMKVTHCKTEYMYMNEGGASGMVRLQGAEKEKDHAFMYLG